MKTNTSLLRKAHFLGNKIRNLRKRNHLTMEDISARCMQIDVEAAPSVSYLSMIENGKRVPSENTLKVIAEVFQKDVTWFLDEISEQEAVAPVKNNRGGLGGMPLEPGFLFSKEHLQIAIPEMLSQTGTSGRQFAHLLIRAHQEHNQNHFPDLERAAEEVGKKQMPLSLDEVYRICQQLGLNIKWFDRAPDHIYEESGNKFKTLVRSFFEPPGIIYINERLKKGAAWLKYDLATHIGHCILHNKDGLRSMNAAGGNLGGSFHEGGSKDMGDSMSLGSQDILHAWRDFECSFFAGALLCPKIPFRQYLNRHAYSVTSGDALEVSTSLLMRRMTAVSPYPHWHYFDAYPSGRLRAVYRGNGIPLPWGNMRVVMDPCQHWAVFRMLNSRTKQPSAQISILNKGTEPRIYCCESIKVKDAAGNGHVLCAGIDINPAIESQGKDAVELAEQIKMACIKEGGSTAIPKAIKSDLISVAKILNIAWIERGIENDAKLICPRSSACPRDPHCLGKSHANKHHSDTEEIRQEIICSHSGS